MEENLPFLLCFALYLRAISKYKPPGKAYVCRGDVTEGLLRYECGGLIFGGAYFQSFTVLYWCCSAEKFPHPGIMIKNGLRSSPPKVTPPEVMSPEILSCSTTF